MGPASRRVTLIPRSASTFVTVPPPAPDPITTTSWTGALRITCAMLAIIGERNHPGPQRRPRPLPRAGPGDFRGEGDVARIRVLELKRHSRALPLQQDVRRPKV